MTENKNFNITTTIELLREDEKLEGEAYAGISLNPYFQWAKIVVTDDIANANKQRVPVEEFDNIIKTGMLSPVKLAPGKISDGHPEALGHAIGTIANLVKESNRIIALAALWKKERPEDIEMLKEKFIKGQPPNTSWELSYSESEFDNAGVETLKGISLNGLAVVAMPAYTGRTAFVAMSSRNSEEIEMEKELEELKTKNGELEAELKTLKETLSQKDKEASDAKAELETLRKFKTDIEAEKAEAEKLASIKSKFIEAGLEKEDAFFEEKKEMFLKMEDTAVDFMVQELVAFSAGKGSASAGLEKKPKVPNLTSTGSDPLSPKELAEALREMNKKK